MFDVVLQAVCMTSKIFIVRGGGAGGGGSDIEAQNYHDSKPAVCRVSELNLNPHNTVWGQFDPRGSFPCAAQKPSASQF